MEPYILGTLLSILLSILISKFFGFKKKKALKMFISILPLTIISAFRYNVGWDYLSIYTTGFYRVGKYHIDWFTEPMFRYILKILYFLFEDPLSLFILISFLTAIFFSLCYKNYGNEKNAWVYILLFVLTRYYLCSLNIIRQALAMMIILYALKYIKEKKFTKYSIFILLATGFHQMSIIFLPLYFILNKNFKKKNYLFLLILAVPLFLILAWLFINSTKYHNYFINMIGNDGELLYSELFIALLIVIISLFKYKTIEKDDMSRIFFNMEIIAFLMSLLSFVLPTADRIIWYFSINNLFFIPLLLSYYKGEKVYLFFTIVTYSFLGIVFYNQTIKSDSYSIIPYQNIIEVRKNK